MEATPYRFVKVQWEDATSLCSWENEPEKFDIAQCTTCGWLVHENEKRLVLTSTLNHNNGDFGDLWAIPRGCIVSVADLSLAFGVEK